ncbi:MAG: hypothetical protein PHC90_14965 [Syntrophorhabdaceae bacterium]|nr:hypothetical protein [Syntrophorhabdaceae bacterium]
MGSLENGRERLEKALAAAYRNRGGPEPGEAWETRVMNGIRDLPCETQGTPWWDISGRLFWRVCPVACAIIIFLTIAVFRYDLAAESYLAQLMADDTVEMVLLGPDNG